MYGGHITDDWDRRLCVSYLEELMQPDLIDGELQLAPGKLTFRLSDDNSARSFFLVSFLFSCFSQTS